VLNKPQSRTSISEAKQVFKTTAQQRLHQKAKLKLEARSNICKVACEAVASALRAVLASVPLKDHDDGVVV
jgi:hypothetical protein